TRAIFGDENSILTVSTLLKNTHYAHDVFAGVPCILSRSGVRSVISLSLDEQEVIQMDRSCQKIYEAYAALHL
ncbi:MAG: L-lactate dehydrogenase, partial [Clostridia bacterium]